MMGDKSRVGRGKEVCGGDIIICAGEFWKQSSKESGKKGNNRNPRLRDTVDDRKNVAKLLPGDWLEKSSQLRRLTTRS